MSKTILTNDPEALNQYRNLVLSALSVRIDYEREARDPDGAVLGLELAYDLIAHGFARQSVHQSHVEGSRSRHPSRSANPPGQVVLTGSYGPDRVLEDGVPAVLQAMLQGAQFGRTVRVRVEEVFGS